LLVLQDTCFVAPACEMLWLSPTQCVPSKENDNNSTTNAARILIFNLLEKWAIMC
jgi:hypothetical protein